MASINNVVAQTRKMTSGSPTRAIAVESLRLLPPDKSQARLLACWTRPSLRVMCSTTCSSHIHRHRVQALCAHASQYLVNLPTKYLLTIFWWHLWCTNRPFLDVPHLPDWLSSGWPISKEITTGPSERPNSYDQRLIFIVSLRMFSNYLSTMALPQLNLFVIIRKWL